MNDKICIESLWQDFLKRNIECPDEFIPHFRSAFYGGIMQLMYAFQDYNGNMQAEILLDIQDQLQAFSEEN